MHQHPPPAQMGMQRPAFLTPKGFRPIAQGCGTAATLGFRFPFLASTPPGLWNLGRRRAQRLASTTVLAVLLACGALVADSATAGGALDHRGQFRVEFSSYLPQHDVVYLSPATAPDDGLPLGNGDFCAMQWNEDTLNLTLNKSDVWTATNRDTEPKTVEEYRELLATHRERLEQLQKKPDLNRWEYSDDWRNQRPPRKTKAQITVPKPATLAEIALKIGGTAVDPARFEERLNLWDGTVSLNNGKVETQTWIDEGRAVLQVTVRDRSGAPGRRLELWHWKEQTFGAENNLVWLDHRERDQTGYALVAAIVGVPATGTVTEPGHRAALVLADSATVQEQEYRILIAAVSTAESSTPLAAAKALIAEAAAAPPGTALARHNDYWHEFWSRSFVDFPDKYLENLWYINLYCMGCTSRGRYPANFENSYFGARDFWMWGAYWQFNEQSLYFPLDMANHSELMAPYTRWIHDSLPAAKLQTMAQFGIEGAQYSHCMTLTGQPFQGPGDMIKYVLSTGGLYALYMWQHYQYTLDPAFLRDQAYPVMLEVGKFYHGYLQNQVGPDGKYIIYPGHPIEEQEMTTGNTTIDIAVIRALANALIAAEQTLGVPEPRTMVWNELRDKLPAYPVRNGVWLTSECYAGPEFEILPESQAYGTLPAWCGFPEGWKAVQKGAQYYGMGTQLAPVFPVGEVGLSSDPARLELARNTYLKTGQNVGTWTPNHICAARLGLREQVLPNIVKHVRNFQITPQGFMSYIANRDGLIVDQERGGGYFDCLDQPRYQPYFEVLGVIATSIGYTLCDSLDGVIRVFPSLPLNGDARFIMRASGAFMVTAEMRAGEIAYISVTSEAGSECRVANPWDTGTVQVRAAGNNRILLPATTDKRLTFPTVKGESYFVERVAKSAESFPVVTVAGLRQTGPRSLPPVMIGLPREGWHRYAGPGPKAIKAEKWREKMAELHPAGLPNLALSATGAKAWVLNPHPAANVTGLNDGIYGNANGVISSSKTPPWEFGIDLGREATIGSVEWARDQSVDAYRDRVPVEYRLEISNDGHTWQTVATVTDNKTGDGRRDSFPPVRARQVRMVVLKTDNLPPMLDELEVSGPDPRWKPKLTPPSVTIPCLPGTDSAALKTTLANAGTTLTDFLLLGQDYLAPYPVEVHAGHDGQSLLLFITCRQPAGTVVPAACPRDAEATFKHDHIELFIVPEPSGPTYFQLGFDAAGNRYDSRCTRDPAATSSVPVTPDLKWNPEWTVVAAMAADAWTAVISLPLKELGLAPGQAFKLEIGRGRPVRFGAEHSTWTKLKTGFHEIPAYGTATLAQK